MKNICLFMAMATGLFLLAAVTPQCQENVSPKKLETGWVVGYTAEFTAVIMRTDDGGESWRVQGDNSNWTGFHPNDVSAVDGKTAWVALGQGVDDGKILHTIDGGETWTEQQLPEGMGEVKQIKGLSRSVAWAAGVNGTVIRTVDGGATWTIIPHPSVTISNVNRMAALGEKNTEMWMADVKGGREGMIHMLDNGETWRQETVNYDNASSSGIHMVGAASKKVAWCFPWWDNTLFRTKDRGKTWEKVGVVGGPNDMDDICSPTENTLWIAQNISGENSGRVFFVKVIEGTINVAEFNPAPSYKYEGISCVNKKNAIVVGGATVTTDPALPFGVIATTKDGGRNWTVQPLPVNDVYFWKVSFVGERR